MTLSTAGPSTSMADADTTVHRHKDAASDVAGPSTGLADANATAALVDCSARHVRRMSDSGQMPRPVRIGRLVRWRLRTGNPMTGVLDWIEAGCPSCRPPPKGGSR